MPVPKVHAWCSHANRTSVQAEYIIMEKAEGVLLSTMLPKMDLKKRWAIARAVADFQMQWVETPFEAYGSLYYRSDIADVNAKDRAASDIRVTQLERFVVGPTTARTYNERGNISVKCDLGPCNVN
jgi:aminoglycoside phosphotransferase (APT) family kinase protein